MLTKARCGPIQSMASSVEIFADTLFEIGRSQARKSRWPEALYWLEQANDLISTQKLQAMSDDAEELRKGIMHGVARALMNTQGEVNLAKAWDIVQRLNAECGESLLVLLLKLDIFAMDLTRPIQEYRDMLQMIVHTVHLSDTNMKTILHHVHKLKDRSPIMAYETLKTLILERLLNSKSPVWLENILITIIWTCTTSSTDFSDILSSLSELLNTLAASYQQALSPSATHAAQTVRLDQSS